MTRLRTHNNRAKRLPYPVFAARRHRAQKVARYAAAYGIGAKSFREPVQADPRYYPHQQEFVNRYFEGGGTVSGRMVSKGPEPMYSLPKRLGKTTQGPLIGTNYAEQEARALEHHRMFLDAARARGDEVTEHTYADATIIIKGGKK